MEEAPFKEQVHLWMQAMYAKAMEMGGELTGEHGIGMGKIPYFVDYVSPQVIDLHRAVKMAFDPLMLLNPGKVFWLPNES